MVSASSRQLGVDLEAALERLEAYFVNESPVQKAAHAIARHFDDLGIDYAIAGAVSLAAYGLVRATEDVDVLVVARGSNASKRRGSGVAT